MTASPEWATWSLETTRVIPDKASIQLGGAKGDATHERLSEGANLFKRTAPDDVHDTEWHDFDEVKDIAEEIQRDSAPQGLDAIDIDEIFKEVQDTGKEIDTNSQDRDMSDIGHFHFEPLSPVESRALQRALKLSKYIPPSAQEAEEEKQRFNALKLTNGRRVGTTMNEETGKRVYSVANRGTGLIARENSEAKGIFKTMCKSMLPRRHFDWIMAQLTYHKCNMIGFDDVPSSRTLLQQEAMESISNGTMSMHDLANVTRLLAEASKVDTSAFDIVDPTKAARNKGRPSTIVKNKMMLQSKAIFEALQATFPHLFQQDSVSPVDTKPIVSIPSVP